MHVVAQFREQACFGQKPRLPLSVIYECLPKSAVWQSGRDLVLDLVRIQTTGNRLVGISGQEMELFGSLVIE